MKVGDEVYLSPKSAYVDGTEFNPIGIKGQITNIANRIFVCWENEQTNSYYEEDLILASDYGVPAMNQGHPNASILMEIAKEAAINKEYWKEFEVATYETTIWRIPESMFHLYQCLCEGTDVRRKPRTIRIGNYDVPEPKEVWHHSFNKNAVCIKFESEHGAIAIVKAIQELLAGK